MSSSYTFTGASFSVVSAARIAGNVIRVVFGQAPLQINASGATDALNVNNYTITGPTALSVVSAAIVPSNPFAIDLSLSAVLSTGSWTVTVANVKTPALTALSAPFSASFDITSEQTSLTAGAENDTAFSIIRKHFNAALAGPNWDALIAALATADDFVWAMAQALWPQLFKATASGRYLTVLGANDGNRRPPNMSDAAFRDLSIELATGRVTYVSLLEILKSFYGKTALCAYLDSSVGPFALVNGQTLVFNFEGTEYTYTVDADSFEFVSAATAQELVVALTVFFQAKKIGATAEVVDGKVRVFSPSLGLRSSVSVSGTATVGFDALTHTIANGDRTVVLSTAVDGELTVQVPATPNVDTDFGSYVSETSIEVTDITAKDGVVTVLTATNHGLVENGQVLIEGFVPQFETPWHTASSGATLGGSAVESVVDATITTSYDYPAIAKLSDGSCVLAGGENLSGDPQVSVYKVQTALNGIVSDASPANGAVRTDYTVTALNNMAAPRTQHGISVLNKSFTDKVLVTGGINASGGLSVDTVELLSGSTWTTMTKMNTKRSRHAQITLDNGDVLVIGGEYSGGALSSCERYSPFLNLWTATGSLNSARKGPSAVKLSDGKILVVGGTTSADVSQNTCELYDPNTGVWTKTTSSGNFYSEHPVAVAVSDRVYVIPRFSGSGQAFLEVFDYATRAWTRGAGVSVDPTDSKVWSSVLHNGFVYVVHPAATSLYRMELATQKWGRVLGTIDARTAVFATDHAVFAAGGEVGALAAVTGNYKYTSPASVNGVHTVSIIDATSFTFQIPHNEWSRMATSATPTATVVAASGDIGKFLASDAQETLPAGDFWITGTSNLTAAAKTNTEESVGYDVELNWNVVYPGDRGLGGEGTGHSDKTQVWGPDVFDGEAV